MGHGKAVQPKSVEVRQHAFRPDAGVRPASDRGWLSGGSSRKRHCYRFFLSFASGHCASIFLHPFAPPALPGFFATMGALTPRRSALRILIRDNEHRPLPSRSLCFMCRTFPPFRLQPPVVVSGFGLVLPRSLPRGLPAASLRTMASFGLHPNSEDGHDNRPNRVRYPADQQFTSSCSPPPLARTQLLSVTTFRPNLTGTCTLLI